MKKRIPLIDISIIGIAAALLIGVQVALSVIPNVELVTLLIILYTIHLRSKAIYIIYIFVLVECLIYPFGLWCIVYLYIWIILYFVAYIFKGSTSSIFFSIIGAIYGLFFGTLSSIPYFFTGGLAGGVAYIIAGLQFDILHCVGNFIVILTLFKPLNNSIVKLPYFNGSDLNRHKVY